MHSDTPTAIKFLTATLLQQPPLEIIMDAPSWIRPRPQRLHTKPVQGAINAKWCCRSALKTTAGSSMRVTTTTELLRSLTALDTIPLAGSVRTPTPTASPRFRRAQSAKPARSARHRRRHCRRRLRPRQSCHHPRRWSLPRRQHNRHRALHQSHRRRFPTPHRLRPAARPPNTSTAPKS